MRKAGLSACFFMFDLLEDFLRSRKRIKIRNMEVTPLTVLPDEKEFTKKDG